MVFHPALAELVKADGQDDDEANDDFLGEILPAHLVGTVAEDGHDQGANHRAENAAGAAVQAGAADDDGGDDVQFEADGDGRVALGEARELHESGQADKQAGKGINQSFLQRHPDAAEAGGGFIGADGEDVATKNGLAHNNRNQAGEGDGDPDSEGQRKQGGGRLQRHQMIDGRGGGNVDRLIAGQPFGRAAQDAHHAESDDERGHVETGNDEAVDQADGAARQDGQRHDGDGGVSFDHE